MPGLDLAPTVSDSAISFAVSGQISVAGIPIAVQGSITLDHLNVKITPARSTHHKGHCDWRMISGDNPTGWVDDGIEEVDDWSKLPRLSVNFGLAAGLTIDVNHVANGIFTSTSISADTAKSTPGQIVDELERQTRAVLSVAVRSAFTTFGLANVPGYGNLPGNLQSALSGDLPDLAVRQLSEDLLAKVRTNITQICAPITAALVTVATNIISLMTADVEIVKRAAAFAIALNDGAWRNVLLPMAKNLRKGGTNFGALGKWLVSELQHRNPQDVIGMLTDLIVSVRAEFEEKKADVASAIEEARSFRPDPAQAFALGQDVIGRLAVEPLLDDLSDVTFGVILIFESPSGPSLLRAASLISDVIVHRAARLGGSAVAAARQVGNGLFLFFSAISSGTLMSLASLGQFLAALDKEVEKGICHFLHDSWNAAVQVGTLAFTITSTFVQADLEIIKKVLDLIVKLVADVGANILHDVQRLQDLFESFGNLERAIFQAPEFADIPAMAGKLHTAFTTGIGKALQAEAREQNVRLIDVLRSKISSNPVLTYLNNISAAMERIIIMPSNVALAEGVHAHGVGGHGVLRTPNVTARREAGIGRPPVGSRATVLAELKKRSMQGRSRLVRPTADKSAMQAFSNSLKKGPVKGGAMNATAGDGASSKEGVASDKKGTQKPEKHRHRAEGEVTVAPQDGKGDDQAGKRGAHRATNLELVDDAYKAAAEEVKSAPYQAPPAKPPANNVANAVFERWLALLEALKELDRDIWDLAFSGASNLDHPFTAEAKLHAVGADAVAAGGQSLGSDLFDISAWPQDAVNIIGGLITQWTHVSVLELTVNLNRLRVPGPTATGSVPFGPAGAASARQPRFQFSGSGAEIDLPVWWPYPFNSSVAVAHLPEFWVIDMRYHMSYGDLGKYRIADLDGDGFVRAQEIETVRKAERTPDDYKESCDCDGDGRVTANDVQLAIEQSTRYVNGLMWKPTTSLLGLWLAPTQDCWGFVGYGAALSDESIPGKITRDGVLVVFDLQLALPAPLNYPIRAHLEERVYIDVFETLKLGGLPPPPIPAVRFDLVVRGGNEGRDWQLYAVAEPFNPLLRTWKLKASGYVRGMASYVAAGRGDLRVSAIYETKVPLIEVIEEWHDRFEHYRNFDFSDLPKPWAIIQALMEWTDVPRLCRALLRIGGPVLDLFLSWLDKDRGYALRSALGYIEQTLLSGWKPGYTWAALAQEVSTIDVADLPEASRTLVLAAIEAVRNGLGATPGDAAFPRRQLLEKSRLALGLPKDGLPPPADPAAASRPLDAGGHKAPPGPSVGTRADLAGAPPQPSPALVKADAALKAFFDGDAGKLRFAMGPDQLVPTIDASSVTLPFGTFTLRDPWIFGLPAVDAIIERAGPHIPKPGGGDDDKDDESDDDDPGDDSGDDPSDSKDAKTDVKSDAKPPASLVPDATTPPAESTGPDKLDRAGQAADAADVALEIIPDLTVRKPVYGSVLRFGRGATIYSVPCATKEYELARVHSGTKGQVVGPRVLEDHDGGWWFFVRTEFKQPGWLRLDQAVVTGAVASRKFGDLTLAAIAPELLQQLNGPVTLMEMSPKGTWDAIRYAGNCYRALNGGTGPNDADIRDFYQRSVDELRVRIFGAEAGRHPDPADLTEAFLKISPLKKRTAFWAQACAWLSCMYYVPVLGKELLNDLTPLLLNGQLEDAFHKFEQFASRTFNFTADEARAVGQSVAPSAIEVLKTLIDIGGKVRSMGKAAKTGEFDFSGGMPAKAGKKTQPTFEQGGGFLLRLFMDDEEQPGAAEATTETAPGQRPDHDHAIGFSFELKSERVEKAKKKAEEKTGTKVKRPTEAEYAQRVGPDVYNNAKRDPKGRAGGMGVSWKDRDKYWREQAFADAVGPDTYEKAKLKSWKGRAKFLENLAYRQSVGEDYYAATKDLNEAQREKYFEEVRRRQQRGEDTTKPIDAGDGKHKKTTGSVGLDFGGDTLTLSWSLEGGGGAGAAEAVAGATVDVDAKYHFTKPQFSVGMLLKDPQWLALAARFCLRFLRHSLHAIDVCVDTFETLPKSPGTEQATALLGGFWWFNVFTLFALKDTIADIVADNAAFIASFLGGMKFEFEVDVNAAAAADCEASIDVNESIVGICSIPLSVILAPIIEMLCAADTTPRTGPSLADRIIPRIEFEVRDAFCGKVGAFPVSIEWESHGMLAKGAFSIPQGSPLRAKIEEIGRDIGVAADKYKKTKKVKTHFKMMQSVLDSIDLEIKRVFSDTGGDPAAAALAALASAGPFVADILAAIQGKPTSTPPASKVGPLVSALRAAKTKGVSVEPGELLHSVAKADGKLTLSLHLTDAEWTAVKANGFQPPQLPTAELETLVYQVPLAGVPPPASDGTPALSAVGWSTWRDPGGNQLTGVVGGFDVEADAEAFAQARSHEWAADEVWGVVFHREGKHWVWVDTELVPKLIEQGSCPLPDLAMKGGALEITFNSAPAGTVQRIAPAILRGVQPVKTPIWNVVLCEGVGAEDKELIANQLTRNRGAGPA